MKALHVTFQTLLGVSKRSEPEARGNCFSVAVEGNTFDGLRVCNFNLENLEALIEKGLTWPIDIEPLGERNALIMDGRIGERWYDDRYCEICTPQTLLPSNQLAKRRRDVLRGQRVEHPAGKSGLTMVSLKFGVQPEFP
jgi:hypothetical protein